MPYKRRYPKERKRVLRKPPPFLTDSILEGYSAGVLVSEGWPVCVGKIPRIVVRTCAEDAVKKVAKVWGTFAAQEKKEDSSLHHNPKQPHRTTILHQRHRRKGEAHIKKIPTSRTSNRRVRGETG